jgi:hypothetical protein
MAQPVTYDSTMDLAPAFPGMIADAMFTDKVTVPCGAAPQPFGTVVASVPATGVSVLPIAANSIEGIAIHEHQIASKRVGGDTYTQYDAISVMRRGRIWARASGACTKDAVAKFDPATGIFADSGSATLVNAKFLNANLTVVAIAPGEATSQIVLVELHSPAIDNIGAS